MARCRFRSTRTTCGHAGPARGKAGAADAAVAAVAAGTAGAAPGSPPFLLRRVVRAPHERMFRAWTEVEQLAKWFGPQGCTLPVCKLDLRPGGALHYCMRFPGGPEWWGKWVFHEVVVPERLVFVVSFSDAERGTCRAPFDTQSPLEMLTTVTFEPHAGIGGGTLVTLQSSAHGATTEECRTCGAGHSSMQQGWTGALDQLAAHLAKL